MTEMLRKATNAQTAWLSEHICAAPESHLRAEPPGCLAELVDCCLEHLADLKHFSGKMRMQMKLNTVRNMYCAGQEEMRLAI